MEKNYDGKIVYIGDYDKKQIEDLERLYKKEVITFNNLEEFMEYKKKSKDKK